MSQWATTREQWSAWIEDRTQAVPLEVLDAWDGQFREVLRALSFGPSAEVTATSQASAEPVASYDSMPTLVREGGHSEDEVDAAETLVHGARADLEAAGALEVSLHSAPGGLQIDLDPLPATSGDWFIPPLTERSVVGPAPEAPQSASSRTVVAPPTAQAAPQRVDATALLGPPPSFDESPTGSAREAAVIRTGNTLIPIEPEAANTQTAGVIVTVTGDDPDEPAPPRRSSKIVISTPVDTAGTAAEAESESDVLESSDLLEALEPLESPPPPPSARPAAPPPPPEPVRAPETARLAEMGEAPLAGVEAPANFITGQTLPPSADRHWSEAVFGGHFAALTRPGADRIAMAEVEFIAAITEMAPTASVVDVGSGEGRHANAFAERGHRTVGLEVSEAQVHLATEAFGGNLPKLRWVCRDVRDHGLTEQFDTVVCLGTTLGIYNDAQNQAVLEGLRDLCAPNGRIVVHVANRDYFVPRLPARTWWQGDGCLVLDEVDVNYATSRINVKRTIVFEDGRQFEHVYDVRVWAVHELRAAFEAAHLRVVEVSGSRHTRGRFFGATSPDIWLVARR